MIHPMILELLDPSKRPNLRLLEVIPLGVSLAVDGKIAYANGPCARMFGYEHGGQLVDLPFFDLIHPEDRAFVMRLWNGRQTTAEVPDPWTYELRGLRTDGTAFPYNCTSISAHVPGHGRCTFAMLADLTELRQAQDRVRVLEQQMTVVERLCRPEDEPAG